MSLNIADIMNVIGLALGVAGLAYALYQGTERKKLESFIRGHAWHIYAKTNNTVGAVQHSLQLYKVAHPGAQINPEVLELLAKSDAFGQDLLQDVIRQIQLAEPRFNRASIASWLGYKKVDPNHESLFLRSVFEDKER